MYPLAKLTVGLLLDKAWITPSIVSWLFTVIGIRKNWQIYLFDTELLTNIDWWLGMKFLRKTNILIKHHSALFASTNNIPLVILFLCQCCSLLLDFLMGSLYLNSRQWGISENCNLIWTICFWNRSRCWRTTHKYQIIQINPTLLSTNWMNQVTKIII